MIAALTTRDLVRLVTNPTSSHRALEGAVVAAEAVVAAAEAVARPHLLSHQTDVHHHHHRALEGAGVEVEVAVGEEVEEVSAICADPETPTYPILPGN